MDLVQEFAVEVRNLVKTFKSSGKKVQAVQGLSFSVPRSQCFGLLGPNGAGKTTTIEIMERIQEADSGEVLYFGAQDRDIKSRIGIQFQKTALPDYLTGREVIKLFGSLYGIEKNQMAQSVDRVIHQCNIEEFVDRDVDKLSGGQRQRVLLALALIHDPEIIFLDEPTTGLDPQARQNFWQLIDGIKKQGKTLILTTHYMEEAYALCDTIAIVDHGKLVTQGNPGTLLDETFQGVVFEFSLSHFKTGEVEQLKQWGEVTQIADHVELRSVKAAPVYQWLSGHEQLAAHVRVRKASLDDLFLHLTGTDLRE